MISITKEFGLIYGHRLWNQTAPPCQCRHLHGHSARVLVTVAAREHQLKNGMVLDFNTLKEFDSLLQTWDHKMILDKNDPLVTEWLQRNSFWSVSDGFECQYVHYSEEGFMKEWYESLILIECEPTSENLCGLIRRWCNHWLFGTGKVCTSVKLFETNKNCAESF